MLPHCATAEWFCPRHWCGKHWCAARYRFRKTADAADPYSFVVESNGIKIGVLTDIGKVCKQTIHYFRQYHAVFLESSYDEEMLQTDGYPLRLQKRISDDKGHLSNTPALQLFVCTGRSI